MLWPQHSYVDILIAKMMVEGGGAFGRWLGHGGGSHMNGISALYKGILREMTDLHHLFCQTRTQLYYSVCETKNMLSLDVKPDNALILGFDPSWNGKNRGLLFLSHPVCVRAAWMNYSLTSLNSELQWVRKERRCLPCVLRVKLPAWLCPAPCRMCVCQQLKKRRTAVCAGLWVTWHPFPRRSGWKLMHPLVTGLQYLV
jgi:hypothetical protein